MKRNSVQTICSCAVVLSMLIVMLMIGPVLASTAETETETAYTSEDCIECHRTGSEESELHMSVKEFEASIHGGEVTCLECHTGVVDEEHQDIEGSGAVDCSACHEQENRHGLGGPDNERPQCHDCHTRHGMLTETDPASTVHPDQLPTTCAGCHAAASGETSYFSWFPAFQIASHNKADFAASYDNDNCLGCHQGAAAHGETEPINEQDCHLCHLSPEADGAMWGVMHPVADKKSQPAVFAAASIYQVFIIVGLAMLLGKVLIFVFSRTSGKSKQ